ncbi:MAG: hypothetical protein GX552_01385 [Chloroflexi bacterium]|nr:hypothetical protein [Chloroflexota bacterium]
MSARYVWGLVVVSLVLVLAACGAPQAPATTAAQPDPTDTAVSAAVETPVAETEGGWVADGAIGAGEYAHETTIGQMRLWWSNDSEYLYIAFEANVRGMVAIGLAPENRMQGANYLIGVVDDGEAQLWDAYGTAPTGNTHPPDEELGGSNDVVAFAGVEEDGVTRFEVQIPLDSGDANDKALLPGETYRIIVAGSNSDSFSGMHTFRASGEITLDAAP